MSRNSTLLLGLAQGALAMLGGYILLLALVFGVMGIYGAMAEQEYLSGILMIVILLVFAGLEFVFARKTIRTQKRWWLEP